jgi:hypothetical protein
MCVLAGDGCEEHDPVLSAWGGEYPGVAECRMRGWYAVLVPGRGWRPCAPDIDGAHEDLNRLAVFQQTGVDNCYT